MPRCRTDFGRRIYRLRAQHDLNSQQFAERIGYSKSFQSEVENGRKDPSLPYVEAIIQRFGLDAHRRAWHRAACKEIGWQI